MNTYRVWFGFGDDEDCGRCNIVDAETESQATEKVAKQLADDPEGFVIGEVEQLN